MSFFDKVKKTLNIGGAKVEVQPVGVLQKGASFTVNAKVVGGKMDQKVSRVVAKLQQRTQSTGYSLGGNRSSQVKTFVISQGEVPGFDLKAGEAKEVSFQLQAAVPSDGTDQSGMMGTLAKLNTMATRQQNEWELVVEAQLEGSSDATARLDVQVQ